MSSKASNVTSIVGPRSIKSSSSTESFKSAVSLQEVGLEVARQVKAIQSLMHAFRTAFQVLHSLIEKRMPSKFGQVYLSAKGLQDSLRARSKEINDKHIEKFREHGIPYIKKFTATPGKFSSATNFSNAYSFPVAAHFQEFSSTIMREVVMKLHELSAEHVHLPKSAFDTLCKRSELCSHLILLHLDQLAASKAGEFDHGFSEELPTLMDMKHDTSSGSGRQLQEGTAIAGLKSAVKQRSETFEEDIRDKTARLDESTDHRNLANDQRDDGPELSLPFIGYALKRFDDYNQARDPPVVPTSRNSVQTTECFVSPSQLSSPHQARVCKTIKCLYSYSTTRTRGVPCTHVKQVVQRKI